MTEWTSKQTVWSEAQSFVNSEQFCPKVYARSVVATFFDWQIGARCAGGQSTLKDNILPHGAVIYFRLVFVVIFHLFPVINFIGNEISGNFSTSKKRCVFSVQLNFFVRCEVQSDKLQFLLTFLLLGRIQLKIYRFKSVFRFSSECKFSPSFRLRKNRLKFIRKDNFAKGNFIIHS